MADWAGTFWVLGCAHARLGTGRADSIVHPMNLHENPRRTRDTPNFSLVGQSKSNPCSLSSSGTGGVAASPSEQDLGCLDHAMGHCSVY